VVGEIDIVELSQFLQDAYVSFLKYHFVRECVDRRFDEVSHG